MLEISPGIDIRHYKIKKCKTKLGPKESTDLSL
jgi:hypothetical protein